MPEGKHNSFFRSILSSQVVQRRLLGANYFPRRSNMALRHKLFSIVLLLSVVVGAIAGGSVALAAPQGRQAQFVAPILVANTSFLNVRSGPGVQYTVLVTIVGGTELPVLARGSDNV